MPWLAVSKGEKSNVPDTPLARLLIVDDEVPQMKALCDTLGDHGFETVGYSSSRKALEVLGKERFDLVLTDLMMPELDGISLLRAALELDPNLAGVVMTGQGSIATAVEAMRSGALDYIQKPFKVSSALPVLNRSLAIRNLRLENSELRKREGERIAELESKNREIASFCGAVAHDLRSPLRAINYNAYLLETDYGQFLDEGGLKSIADLKRVTKTMDTLIGDLLMLARATESEIRPDLVDITQLANMIANDLRRESEREVVFEIEPGLSATADERLVRVALTNLLGNAWKFTSNVTSARISVGGADGVFCVHDNGAGFPAEMADRLFQPFERLHSEKEFAGTGIGLATVRRVVERHGGKVWAESPAESGATFYFTLPLATS